MQKISKNILIISTIILILSLSTIFLYFYCTQNNEIEVEQITKDFNNQLTAEKNNSVEEMEKLNKKIKELEDKKKEQEQKIKELESLNNQLTAEKNNSVEEMEKLNKKIKELEDKKKEQEQKIKEMEKLNKKIKELERLNNQLTADQNQVSFSNKSYKIIVYENDNSESIDFIHEYKLGKLIQMKYYRLDTQKISKIKYYNDQDELYQITLFQEDGSTYKKIEYINPDFTIKNTIDYDIQGNIISKTYN